MKCLKIENGLGYLSIDGSTFKPLDKISKDDISSVIDILLDESIDAEIEDYNTALLTNSAHKIIYENLYNKFYQLIINKSQFNKEISELYKDACEAYKFTDSTKISS